MASEAVRVLLATEPNLKELEDGLRRIVEKLNAHTDSVKDSPVR